MAVTQRIEVKYVFLLKEGWKVRLRIERSRNNQKEKVRWAKDYEI